MQATAQYAPEFLLPYIEEIEKDIHKERDKLLNVSAKLKTEDIERLRKKTGVFNKLVYPIDMTDSDIITSEYPKLGDLRYPGSEPTWQFYLTYAPTYREDDIRHLDNLRLLCKHAAMINIDQEYANLLKL